MNQIETMGVDFLKSYKHSKSKQLILDTAYRLFSEKGYKKTTLRDIAANAGRSLGATTYYFKKKSDIAKVLYQDFTKHFYTQIRDIYLKMDLTTIEADTVYLSTSILVELTNAKLTCFIYDLGQEGLLTEIMMDTIFMQFARKNAYLNLGLDNQSLFIDSLFYIGLYQQLLVGIKNGYIHDLEKALYLFNKRHLQQLQFSEHEIKAILEKALPICHEIEVEMADMFDISLNHPNLLKIKKK